MISGNEALIFSVTLGMSFFSSSPQEIKDEKGVFFSKKGRTYSFQK